MPLNYVLSKQPHVLSYRKNHRKNSGRPFTINLLIVVSLLLHSSFLFAATQSTEAPQTSQVSSTPALIPATELKSQPPLTNTASASTSLTPAAAAAVTATTNSAIPFKKEHNGLGEQSLSALATTIALLAVTIAGLYLLRNFLRKKLPKTFHFSSNIQLKERLRINPKLDIYVIQYQAQEIMFAQSGQQITLLTAQPSAPPNTQDTQDAAPMPVAEASPQPTSHNR